MFTPVLYLVLLVSPFLLWPLEILLPFPSLIEEFFKAICILLLHKTSKPNYRQIFIFGLIFSLSETLFYLFNFSALGNASNFLPRIFLTTILHTSTFLIIYFGSRRSSLLFAFSLILSVLIHFFFNRLV